MVGRSDKIFASYKALGIFQGHFVTVRCWIDCWSEWWLERFVGVNFIDKQTEKRTCEMT